MTVIAYRSRDGVVYPVARVTVSNEHEARMVAASMAARRVGDQFDLLKDGRAAPMKIIGKNPGAYVPGNQHNKDLCHGNNKKEN